MDWGALGPAVSIVGGALGGVVAAWIGVRYQLRRDQEDWSARITRMVHDTRTLLAQEIKGESKELHTRISELRDDTFKELLSRIGTIEGRLVGIDNIMRTLVDRYMGAK